MIKAQLKNMKQVAQTKASPDSKPFRDASPSAPMKFDPKTVIHPLTGWRYVIILTMYVTCSYHYYHPITHIQTHP